MAPGAAGAGGGPGGSRPTGTVPKTKGNDQGRDVRREQGPPLNHVSNNLLGLDWQTAQTTYDRRTRKNSNRSFSDNHEQLSSSASMDGGSTHDNRCMAAYTPPDGSQWSSPGRTPPGTDVASPNRDQAQRNVMRDKSNISKTADRNEVVSRLNQICDYIKHTSYLMDTLKNSENSNLVELDCNGGSSGRGSVRASPGSNLSGSRASSQGRRQSGAEREELRMKVEESQRKLQALQEHQAALAALQEKARQQLLEARHEQNALMVHCSAGEGEESLDEAVKLDQLQQRLQSLAEMCHNRNQLASQLGGEAGGQEDMLPEQLVLQNKLQQLQSKKQHMDHLVAALHVSPSPAAPTPGPREAAQDGDKVAQLNLMKQQLAHLKDLVASVERNKEAGDVDTEEQAVNLRRQNVRGSSAEDDLASDINARTQRLRDAQGRLQQLQDLMGLVGEAHATGRPLSDHYVEAMLHDATSSVYSCRPGQDAAQADKNTSCDKDLHPATREKKTNSQSQRQLLALELQAKRLELEALMSKDQGPPSAINHDKPHPLLADYGVAALGEAATWGSSTIEDVADHELRDQSLCYSSDEGADEDEEEDVEPFPAVQLSANTLGQSPGTNKQSRDLARSMGSVPSPRPCPHLPGGAVTRPAWVSPHNTSCSKTARQTVDYATDNNTHASVLSNATSANNVWKPPHLQGEGAQAGWGMLYSPLPGDSYYQQLLATSQIQQQNMVLTMLNQCCQLLWLQQRDLQALRSAVHSLQERGNAGPGAEPVAETARCNNAATYGLFLPTQDDVQLNNCFPTTPALNNQVPPGNRANNYWDNFRSYSRQNLLSNSAGKSNEGPAVTSHSPSPLVERSHNSLQGPALSLGAASLPSPPEQLPQALPPGRKEKLNADQCWRANQRAESNNLGPTAAVKKKRHPNPKMTAAATRNTPKCAGREPVYEEVTALISANKSRPDFLLHLFRELRALHSTDPPRQSALRSIHPLAQRLTSQEEAAGGVVTASSAVEEDEDKVSSYKRPTSTMDWVFPSVPGEKGSAFCLVSADQPQVGEGAGAGEMTGAAVPEPLPRNAAWKVKDLLTASPELQLLAQGQGHGRPDWHVQGVVAELRPLLRVHQDDTCTPALLETLRHAAVRLLPPDRGDAYCCSQLDTLLHEALQRFLHCRLGSVAEQLLGVVADLMQSEMSFLVQAGQLCRPPSPVAVPAVAVAVATRCESTEWRGLGDVATADHLSSSLPLVGAVQTDSVVATADLYNGDLAEADQSCHAECDGADNSCDGEAGPLQEASTTCNESQLHEMEEEAVRAEGDSWDGQDWAPPPSNTPGSQSP